MGKSVGTEGGSHSTVNRVVDSREYIFDFKSFWCGGGEIAELNLL